LLTLLQSCQRNKFHIDQPRHPAAWYLYELRSKELGIRPTFIPLGL